MSKSRKKTGLSVAALLLSETAACVPICDPVPPPPQQTSIAATRTAAPGAAPTRTPSSQPPPICDPVPPPPMLTSIAATATARAKPSPAGTAPVSPLATPTPTATASPRAELPLQQRLKLRIVGAGGADRVFRVEANFPVERVVWTVSGGVVEACEGGVRWHPPRRRGTYLLQAAVDAGSLGVAVDAIPVDVEG